MAQKIEDVVFRYGLDYIKQGAAALNMKIGVAVAPAANATIASWWGSTANCLAMATISSGTTDLEITTSSSGLKLIVGAKVGMVVNTTGVADSVAVFSTASSYVYAVTTCAQQTLGSTSNTVTLSSWVITLTN